MKYLFIALMFCMTSCHVAEVQNFTIEYTYANGEVISEPYDSKYVSDAEIHSDQRCRELDADCWKITQHNLVYSLGCI